MDTTRHRDPATPATPATSVAPRLSGVSFPQPGGAAPDAAAAADRGLAHPAPRERRADDARAARALAGVFEGARLLQRGGGTTRAVEWLRLHDVHPELIRRVLDPAAPRRAGDPSP